MSPTDLVTENAAENATHDRPRNARAAVTADLLPIDPAPLLWLTDHRTHGRHIGRIELLAVARIVLVPLIESRRRCDLLRPGSRAHRTHRRDLVVQTDRAERWILARLQDEAA